MSWHLSTSAAWEPFLEGPFGEIRDAFLEVGLHPRHGRLIELEGHGIDIPANQDSGWNAKNP